MKGRDAVRSARRREAEAREEVEQLRAEIKQMESDHRKTVVDLESKIRRLRVEAHKEAGKIAAKTVQQKLAEAKEERRKRGFSDELAIDLMYQKDKFVRNACRYISMTKGFNPRHALTIVCTWMTDDDCYGLVDSVDLMIKLGLPRDGWVHRMLKRDKHLSRTLRKQNLKRDDPPAISLDRAEREGHEDIHPEYTKKGHLWYSKVEYGGIEVVEDADDAQSGTTMKWTG